jgi:sortase A
MTVGRILLVAGVLVLLFIPYLLWGTGLQTAHSQNLLRAQFKSEQHQAGVTSSTTPPKKAADTPPQVAPTEAQPAVGSAVGTIDIPEIGLQMVVVQGTDVVRLQQGPGHYTNTPLPGEAGNSAIAGHRTTYLHPFYNLNELNPGNPIYITTTQGLFQYDVISSQAVSPSDVSVVDTTTSPELTLTTCTPRYSASQRLVVHAVLAASILAHAQSDPSTKTATPTKPKTEDAAVPPGAARSWPTAIAWGVAVAAIVTGVWIAARRTRRGIRALVVGGGLVVWLVVVFAFFEALAPLLPASY